MTYHVAAAGGPCVRCEREVTSARLSFGAAPLRSWTGRDRGRSCRGCLGNHSRHFDILCAPWRSKELERGKRRSLRLGRHIQTRPQYAHVGSALPSDTARNFSSSKCSSFLLRCYRIKTRCCKPETRKRAPDLSFHPPLPQHNTRTPHDVQRRLSVHNTRESAV